MDVMKLVDVGPKVHDIMENRTQCTLSTEVADVNFGST